MDIVSISLPFALINIYPLLFGLTVAIFIQFLFNCKISRLVVTLLTIIVKT